MDRKRLARIAYIAAADRLLARCDAGALSREEGSDKLASLRRAYDKRVADIEFGAFLKAHGLMPSAEFRGLDASLSKMAAEHAAGTVGGVELARVA